MIIGLTGASGFIGKHFTAIAKAAGHEVIGFSRRPQLGQRNFEEMDFSGLDAVVHLAGESVLGLWTAGKKKRIYASRVDVTKRMVERMKSLPNPPKVLVSASGISYYGDRGAELLDESSSMGSGFLAEVVRDWDAAVAEANAFARTASVRLGMVLGKESGAWPMLRRIFKLALGGRLGNGKQFMPWIHVKDAARLLLFTVENEAVRGVVNGVAEPVTNAEFTKQLAAAVHRPALIPTPAFALKMLPGGMAAMFLDSMKIEAKVAAEAGFKFEFPTLEKAFDELLSA